MAVKKGGGGSKYESTHTDSACDHDKRLARQRMRLCGGAAGASMSTTISLSDVDCECQPSVFVVLVDLPLHAAHVM